MSRTLSLPRPAQAPAAQGPVEIVEVRSRADRRAFLEFPWAIYRDDPLWVPPLLHERAEFINPRKHPFYQHGTATMFLARRGGIPVGRVLVSDDPRFNAQHGTNTGCFGMFESIDDPRVSCALLDAAAGWLVARGRSHIQGPIDYSTNYTCGLLVDGFHMPPRVLMNHNPPYYERLLTSWGLSKSKDLYGWWFTNAFSLEDKWVRFAQRMAQRGRVTIRPFNLKDAHNEVARCQRIYNTAWRSNWGFVEMTDAEFSEFARSLIQFVPPDMTLLAEVEGEVVGLVITLPDFNEAIRPLDGRLFRWGLPLGLWELKRNLKRVRTGRLVALGVLEGYRRRGISELLILQTLLNGMNDHRYTAAELGWTLEDNELINSAIETVGAERYKTYRIYEKPLSGTASPASR